MREIKFRGKRVDNDEWVCGWYIEEQYSQIDGDLRPYIVRNGLRYEVIPETVGQFTGLQDRNGFDVYEGDIIRWNDNINIEKDSISKIAWIDKQGCWGTEDEFWLPNCNISKIEVIGNKWETK